MIYNLPSLIYDQEAVHTFYIKFAMKNILTLPVQVGRNICHGSDAVESAEREIAMWFPNGTQSWTHHSSSWLYE